MGQEEIFHEVSYLDITSRGELDLVMNVEQVETILD